MRYLPDWLAGIVGTLLGAVVGLAAAIPAAIVLLKANDATAFLTAYWLVPLGSLIGVIGGIYGSRVVLRFFRAHAGNPSARTAKGLIVGALLLGVPGFVVGAGWMAVRITAPPSDDEMIANFRRNKPTLDRLVAMCHEDKQIARVDRNWTSTSDLPSAGLSPERIALYRRLLAVVHAPRGFSSRTNGTEIEFHYYLHGWVFTDATEKGYLYSVEPPKPILKSLDKCDDESCGEPRPRAKKPMNDDDCDGGFVSGFRSLGGDWYIHYEHTPD